MFSTDFSVLCDISALFSQNFQNDLSDFVQNVLFLENWKNILKILGTYSQNITEHHKNVAPGCLLLFFPTTF